MHREWYGEPIGDTVQRLIRALHITQGQLADIVGLSAPMLSQLASGQRAKIGNPAVWSRFQQVAQIADDPALDQLPRAEAEGRLARVRGASSAGALTGASTANGAPAVQAVLRALASAAEIEDAARRLEPDHPALAEFLRVYGTGRTGSAREHFQTWTRG